MHAGVDSSASALQLARTNARLNGIAVEEDGNPDEADQQTTTGSAPSSSDSTSGTACTATFERADVAEYLKQAQARGEGGTWDVVILDPPKLAPTRSVNTE